MDKVGVDIDIDTDHFNRMPKKSCVSVLGIVAWLSVWSDARIRSHFYQKLSPKCSHNSFLYF